MKINKNFVVPVSMIAGDSIEFTWTADNAVTISGIQIIADPIEFKTNYSQISTVEIPVLESASPTCSYCGNLSDLRDHRGNCVACGAPRRPPPDVD